MIVTLDVYSGRPNPSWRLSDKDHARLLERVSGKALADETEVATDAALGPRGFVISAARDDEVPQGVPFAFRIGVAVRAPQAVAESHATPHSASELQEISRFLLSTGSHVLDPELMEFLEASIQKIAQPAPSPADLMWEQPAEPAEPAEELTEVEAVPSEKALAAPAVAIPACIIANTPYNPAFWNRPAVQPKNNCYNYAMNWRSDTFAQPGRISGHQYTAINCAAVGTAADWDGCHSYCRGSNKNVALVIAPGPGFVDFHWYRRHREGFWGHKPGGTAARNVDNRGRLINGTTLTPANCDRGPYRIFCGYRYSPTGMRVS
jgi:hypothetical protein